MAESGETLQGSIDIQPSILSGEGLSFNLSIKQEIETSMTGDVKFFISSGGTIAFNETS